MKDVQISPELAKLLTKLQRGSDEILMTAIGGAYTRAKKAAIGQGRVPGPPMSPVTARNRPGDGGHALADTGALMRSISFEASSDSVTVGTPLIYGRIVHDGGTITARRAQKLAIPAGRRWAALTRAAGRVRELLRAYPGAVRFTSKAILIFNGREYEVAFYRKRSVTIPARPFLAENSADLLKIREIYTNWALRDG